MTSSMVAVEYIEKLGKRCCTGSTSWQVLTFSWLGWIVCMTTPGGHRLKSIWPMVTEGETHKGGFTDMSDEVGRKRLLKHDFSKSTTAGNKMQMRGQGKVVMFATVEVSAQAVIDRSTSLPQVTLSPKLIKCELPVSSKIKTNPAFLHPQVLKFSKFPELPNFHNYWHQLWWFVLSCDFDLQLVHYFTWGCTVSISLLATNKSGWKAIKSVVFQVQSRWNS